MLRECSIVSMDSKSKHFILCHEEAIKVAVDLSKLVPKLYSNRVLTPEDREELLYEHVPPNQRKTKLVTILSNKGRDAPSLLIKSLREEKTHLPHAELATLLERDFQASHGQDGGGSTGHLSHGVLATADTNGTTALPVAPMSAGPSHSLPTHVHIHVHTPSLCDVHSHASSSTAHTSDSGYQTMDSQESQQHGYHFAPHRAPHTGVSHSQSPSSCVPPVANSLEQLQQFSAEYANLILCLSANITQRGFTFEDISTALKALLDNSAIPFELPVSVNDFPTLCLHLRRLNMCHEADVDLLCELLRTMQLEDLKQVVMDYVNRVSSVDVMQHRYQEATSLTERHFLMFTFHNFPALSVGEACEIKHQMSDLLHIPRHTFSLVKAEPGSIGLAWQMPMQYLKHVRSSLEEDKGLRTSLVSSQYCFQSIKLLIKEGSDRIVMFSRSTSPASIDETKCRERSCVSKSSQEDTISSTMDDPLQTDSHSRKSLLYTLYILQSAICWVMAL